MPNRLLRAWSNVLAPALTVLMVTTVATRIAHAEDQPVPPSVEIVTFPPLSRFAVWKDVQERLALSALQMVLPELTLRTWEAAEQFFTFEQRDLLIERGHCLESDVTTPLRNLLLSGALCELSLAIGVEPRWEFVIDHLSQLMFQSGHITPYDQVRELESKLHSYWFEFVASLRTTDEPAPATAPILTEEESI